MNVTPMMRQYLDLKEQYKDCLLFFRLGDFYEMFFEDALTASRELEITLTGRDCGLEERAPMCGVPFHAAENYISRLVEKGYKVAIGEQVEEAGASKGIVKRDVVRVVTPGTILEGNTISEGKNNYIVALTQVGVSYGLSICDVSTGEWQVTEVEGEESRRKLCDELAKFSPVECLIQKNLEQDEVIYPFVTERLNCLVQALPEHYLDETLAIARLLEHFEVLGLESIGLKEKQSAMLAASALLNYLKETQKNTLAHLKHIGLYNMNAYMLLDLATRRNLELTETLREKKRKGSLLWVLDHTKTAMGARALRRAVEQPLIDAKTINRRLEATTELKENPMMREELREAFSKIYDMERLVGKIAYGTCNAKELIALKHSLAVLPEIKTVLNEATSETLSDIAQKMDTLEDVYTLINIAIMEEAPISLREGGLVKNGYHEEVDRLREVKEHGTSWLVAVETKEKENTGIKNLKIKYNKVFGYFLEVTQSYSHLVPDYFIRKQTLSNCERYITEELKEIEQQVLGADEKLQTLEYQLFVEVREKVARHIERLLKTSGIIATLDLLASLADVAEKNGYIKPIIEEGDVLEIKEGRHPVVEKMMGGHQFIGNDVYLNESTHRINLITGPNMAGKSTYMRQVALIVLMAQIGAYVPAESARIGVVDRIFTRVGASDDLASGQSTFMVEMMEVANILHHATHKSLLILDEIGRGTSTIDGLSIAWSIIEHIAEPQKLGAKTLFATHYHELTTLEATIEGVQNYCVTVKEVGEDIIFLRKMAKGSVDHSYGIQVAKLAGLPEGVLKRARAIMDTIEQKDSKAIRTVISEQQATSGTLSESKVNESIAQAFPKATKESQKAIEEVKQVVEASQKEKQETLTMVQETPQNLQTEQLDLFATKDTSYEIVKAIRTVDLMGMTPMDAMQFIYKLQKKLK